VESVDFTVQIGRLDDSRRIATPPHLDYSRISGRSRLSFAALHIRLTTMDDRLALEEHEEAGWSLPSLGMMVSLIESRRKRRMMTGSNAGKFIN
jgi:hypothetical protein